MTYCVGWKHQGAVFLLADAAITKLAEPSSDCSSFGELHGKARDEHVEEALLKLVPVGKGTAVAFAGNVQLASQCIEFLREGLARGDGINEVLRSLSASLGPFSVDRAVELLLASSTESGECDLIRWSTVSGTESGESPFHQIGSLTSFHAELTRVFIRLLVSGRLDTRRMLPVATAIVQTYGVHDRLIDMNVGGLIFGVQTERGNVSWQGDTNYVLCDPAMDVKAWITAAARDNVLLVRSSISGDIRVFMHSASMPAGGVSEQWLARASVDLDSGKSNQWIFISTREKVITIIFREDVSRESRYVRLASQGGSNFVMSFSPELQALLRKPLEHRNDGSLPLRLNVLPD